MQKAMEVTRAGRSGQEQVKESRGGVEAEEVEMQAGDGLLGMRVGSTHWSSLCGLDICFPSGRSLLSRHPSVSLSLLCRCISVI